jgi:antitoxin (DNA-binding transcriptional repressor) of toxin-antitoxin stability system
MLERSDAMQFTSEQLEAVRSGQSVRLTEEGTDIVVLRADVFERLRDLLYDDSSWSDEEMDLLAAEDADRLGWEGMESYQDDR